MRIRLVSSAEDRSLGLSDAAMWNVDPRGAVAGSVSFLTEFYPVNGAMLGSTTISTAIAIASIELERRRPPWHGSCLGNSQGMFLARNPWKGFSLNMKKNGCQRQRN
ncbi:hypothetical protein PIB30_060506 [Stylosanthes scabra]|uniref:Uncharacterized protein n=1 Tax=Stylosanthes scabra TaxID=79078 RepID=A0ABU6YI22_9FABA|nr:hypothetical protein [Stylosanthes scabra]